MSKWALGKQSSNGIGESVGEYRHFGDVENKKMRRGRDNFVEW